MHTHYFDEKEGKMPERQNLKTGFLRKRFKKNTCIHGHFNKARGFGIQDYYPEVDQFITILRDPLEITLSNYFFAKKRGDRRYRNGKPFFIREQFIDVSDYLKKENSYLMLYMPFNITIENYEEILEKYFVYIGIQEDLQTSVDIMAKHLDYPAVTIGHVNVSNRDEIVSEELKEEFKNRCKLEYAIYNYALKNYKKVKT